MNFEEIMQSLGALTQDELRSLNSAVVTTIRTKQKVEAAALATKLKEGDTVRITNIRPRSLEGLKGTIVAPSGKSSFYVMVDGHRQNVPTACLRLV
jgi:hypothetical protein